MSVVIDRPDDYQDTIAKAVVALAEVSWELDDWQARLDAVEMRVESVASQN